MTNTERVETFLRNAPDLGRVSFDRVADPIGIGKQAVTRRLRDEGSSYNRILVKERQRRTFDALDKNLSINCLDLANIAGYTTATAFCKAFQGWAGMTLRAYKKKRGDL